jgi:hypothetical protein
MFGRYIGIDYSGAETADSSCKGIRVFMAEGSGEPAQVQPPPSPRRYWTRRGLAKWLCNELDGDIAFCVPNHISKPSRRAGDILVALGK